MTVRNKPKRSGDPTIYVLYHKNCSDGLAASYVAWEKFGELAEYIPVGYNESLPHMDITDQTEIYIVDFSYPAHVIKTLKAEAKTVQIIDHHKSAYDDFIHDLAELYLGIKICDGMDCQRVAEKPLRLALTKKLLKHCKTFFTSVCKKYKFDPPIFDMSKSGAMLAWKFFNPSKRPPDIIRYVSDRDTWTLKLPNTKAALEGLFFSGLKDSYEYWHALATDKSALEDCIAKGRDILKYKHNIINKYKRPEHYSIIMFNGYKVCVYNAIDFIDEIAEELYTTLDVDYTLSYYMRNDGTTKLSLRSRSPGGPIVIPMAKYWGGGGHEHSGGASLNIKRTMEFLELIHSSKLLQSSVMR